MIARWCGQDASNAFAAAGPPHHAGAVAEKGYGPLVVGALDTRSHRARSAQPGAAAAAPAEDLGWREDVGRQSWFHYHSVAAKYPENATAIDVAAMQGLEAQILALVRSVEQKLHGEKEQLRGELVRGVQGRAGRSVWTDAFQPGSSSDIFSVRFEKLLRNIADPCFRSVLKSHNGIRALTKHSFFWCEEVSL